MKKALLTTSALLLTVGVVHCGRDPAVSSTPTVDASANNDASADNDASASTADANTPADAADAAPSEVDPNSATGIETKFVSSAILMPTTAGQYAIDVDGDGNSDNRFGTVLAALTSQSLDVQGSTNQLVAAGKILFLLKTKSDDATFTDDQSVAVTYQLAQAQENPDFGGTGTFTPESGDVVFGGRLAGGVFSSNPPATTKSPVNIVLRIALGTAGVPLEMNVNGAHILFRKGGCKSNETTPSYCGELHGSIKADEIQNVFVPALATLYTDRIAADPTAGDAQTLQTLFDTGGCSDNGTPAAANDEIITACEVRGNKIISGLLSPDVQIFAEDGSYAPAATPTKADSLSIGIGFEAVKASF